MSIESHHIEGVCPLREILCSCFYLLDRGKGKHLNRKTYMCKSEIFAEIIEAVSRETEVSASQILGCSKHMEVVDARSILVKLLNERGLYPEQIAVLLHKTAASIRYLLSNYESRKSANKIIAIYAQNIRKVIKKDA